MTDLAEQDLESAGDYIAFVLLNPSAAENTVRGIREKLDKLRFFPESHGLDDDPVLRKLKIHKSYYKDYKIFYIINYETCEVFIIRIIHMLSDSTGILYQTLGITGRD